ncbi:MAG: DUF5906 domain-containing protein [Clostridium sp.]|nr:DUF5906 domain-containing protein [Clostridium sp.]
MLNCLFNPNDVVCFRILDDRKKGVFTGQKLSVECGKYASIEQILKEHNAQNRGIFFTVNYGGPEDRQITRINAQFVESDELSIEEQKERIEAFCLPPSMVIQTRKSLHTYWFVKDAKVERFRGIQKQLVKQFHGDPMCVNESRIMRLPGFYHCKSDPVLVRCILFHPERVYTQDQLSEALPDAEEQPVETKKGTEKGLRIVARECDFIRYCQEHAAKLSEHDWYAMISNLAVFEGGVEMIHALSKPYPGYDATITQKKINHFLESGTRPINCRTIREKGYACPKLASGECDCKAPAALCYQPIRSDGLVSMIEEFPVSVKALENMQVASNFVSEYLFNQDKVIAETIITTELREHFRFTASGVKPLVTRYRELSRIYQQGLKARKHKVENELPLWYVPTEHGLKFMPGILAEAMKGKEDVFYAAEQHYAYRDGVYRPIHEMEAQRMVRDRMLSSETRMNQITDAERQWRLLIRKEIRELNVNPYILNVKNGLYNVLDDTLTEHTKDYYSTVQLSVNYDPEASCPLFQRFLLESMEGDTAQVVLLQEMLGYFLVPVNSAQKCFVIVGAAGAGKSVLLRVLNELLLGKENVSNVSWQALNERFKTAELFGKLANIFADLPTKNIDDNGIFKALVGEDYLTVEKKNKDPFSFRSNARLLFSCNSIPKNYGDRSEGFYRRLIIIRFNRTIPAEQRDPNLIEKFRSEADGIFLFALEGLRKLMQEHYVFSETEINRAELQQYREESDSVLSFLKECCQFGVEYEVGSTELFQCYKNYCEECGLRPFSQKLFVTQILATNPTITRSVDRLGRKRTLLGLKLGEILD